MGCNMKAKTFTSVDGLELIIKNRKSAIIFEVNQEQLINKKYNIDLKFEPMNIIELYNYIETISNESWTDVKPKEAYSFGSDYYEYYDKELDNNGYLRIKENTLNLERPSLDSKRFYQFNKKKIESFLYDFKKLVKEN